MITPAPLPPLDPGLVRAEYAVDELGVSLSCFFEFTPEDGDVPPMLTLAHAFLPASPIDVVSILKYSLIDAIEAAAMDRWLDLYDGANPATHNPTGQTL